MLNHGQEWNLYKVWDSKIELSESENEEEYQMSTGAVVDGSAAHAALSLRNTSEHAVLLYSGDFESRTPSVLTI